MLSPHQRWVSIGGVIINSVILGVHVKRTARIGSVKQFIITHYYYDAQHQWKISLSTQTQTLIALARFDLFCCDSVAVLVLLTSNYIPLKRPWHVDFENQTPDTLRPNGLNIVLMHDFSDIINLKCCLGNYCAQKQIFSCTRHRTPWHINQSALTTFSIINKL